MQIVKFFRTVDISEKIDTLFKSEKQKLGELFPDADIEHVGGSAIPEALSKGDLDINIRVSLDNFEAAAKILKTLYEINQPKNWSKHFASFKDDSRQLGIQLTVIDSPEDFFVAQREYLKSHPEVLSELNALKEKFEGKDMNEYRKEKGEFFERLNSHLLTPDPRA